MEKVTRLELETVKGQILNLEKEASTLEEYSIGRSEDISVLVEKDLVYLQLQIVHDKYNRLLESFLKD